MRTNKILCVNGIDMSIITKNSLDEIWASEGSNNYACFADLKGKHGVYIFRDQNCQILYVGEARKQDLKTRVIQNFSESDNGGTFRKNFMSEKHLDFGGFKEEMKLATLIFIVSEKSDMLIRALESLLILTLNPKYNKDI
ncbi:GIY-YIG nuclease family protein [Shewanella baltica]|uniref:GIY-YIG nuclease family protein n=1 Tax=Shewanella baltica TaxID=62322 RepID=UPI00217D5717|nr:GIY-YIG nuclease family protein [Shewanella baltica]MCS6120528.1 GIY-YIG nuclease family protein [Shewanella baltica]